MAEDLLGLGKAAEAIFKELGSFLHTLLGPAAEEAGQLIVDQIRYIRFKWALPIFQKARKLLEDNGIEPKAVPLKILVPILENCSLEDNDDLTSKWAGLLASAAAGNAVHVSYPRILAELTPDEARMLDAMYQRLMENRPNERQALFAIRELNEKAGLPVEQFIIALDNLRRLELCDVPSGIDPFLLSSPVFGLQIKLTALGENFVMACRGPKALT